MSTPLKKVESALGLVEEPARADASNDRAAEPTAAADTPEGVEALAAAAAKAKAKAKAKAEAEAEAKAKAAAAEVKADAKPKSKETPVADAKAKDAKAAPVVAATPKAATPNPEPNVKAAPRVVEAKVRPAPAETKPEVPGGPPAPAAPSAPAASVGNRDAAAAVRALRRARARRLGLRAALGIGLPTLLASVYYFFVASSQYESVSLFTVQSAEPRGMAGLETLIGAVPAAATHDTLAVRDFITSRDMLALLERQLKLSEHYADPVSDWWARLTNRSSSEDTYDYYREMVQVDYDSTSGVLTLRVRAFGPGYAKKVADAVLSESEKMVNHLSERARLDQTKVARQEVTNAEQRLTKARLAIVELQQEHAEFNPEQTATEAFTLRGALKGELAMARAELMEARAFMQPNAPKVVALEERVRSLSAQVTEESRRLVNPKGDKGLSNSMAEFDVAMVEKEFAQRAYQSALTSLEMARSEASRQHRYLATIAKPSTPNRETHPKRVRGVITVVLLSAMLLGIAMLLVEAIREHARI